MFVECACEQKRGQNTSAYAARREKMERIMASQAVLSPGLDASSRAQITSRSTYIHIYIYTYIYICIYVYMYI